MHCSLIDLRMIKEDYQHMIKGYLWLHFTLLFQNNLYTLTITICTKQTNKQTFWQWVSGLWTTSHLWE
jgi:hypothetical protein